MPILLVFFVAVVLAGGIGLFWLVQIYNGLVAARHEVDRSWSNIDVLLKQRHDELPKLVEVCKGYMAHERTTLEAVIGARQQFGGARTAAEQAKASDAVSSALRQLFAVAESYPQLRAAENFGALQVRISDLESQIADRRELYNAAANAWNVRIEQVPDVVLARAFAYRPRDLWKANEEDRADVKLHLVAS